MATLAILNKEGAKTKDLNLPENIFCKYVKEGVLHQAIVKYQASLRQGTVDTKQRADVRGGGRKPHRQKGTGRARAGSTRSPLWRGGGVTFGPHPRDFSYTIPKKMKRVALSQSLNAKYQSGDLHCIDELTDPIAKTKEFAKILKNLELKGKVLALLDGSDKSVFLSSRNIPRFTVLRTEDVNAYDILRHKKVLLTKTAFDKIVERIQK